MYKHKADLNWFPSDIAFIWNMFLAFGVFVLLIVSFEINFRF